MVRTLLVRGMLVGILAGPLVFAVGRVVGEPTVDRAIGFESAMDAARMRADEARGLHPVEEPELVSRPVQAGIGLFTGVMVYSAAFGGLFGLVFAAVDRRIGTLGPRATAALLAALGLACLYVVPSLEYPANPPSVGAPGTIGLRTGLYFAMLGLSLLAMVGAMVLRGRMAPRLGAWNAALLAAGTYLVVVAVAAALMPAINEVPETFPAVVLWRFRMASLAMQLTLWTTLGLVFGALTERAYRVSASTSMRMLRTS